MKLKKHQENAIEKFEKSEKGIIVFHGVGTGKTITSISCANKYPDKVPIFVTQSAILKQFKIEVEKHTLNSKAKVYSYTKFSDLLETNQIPKNRLIVLDEAHRLRNHQGKTAKLVLKYCEKYAFKTIFLTATPFVNYPWDIVPLMNIISDYNLPTSPEKFKKLFYSIHSKFPYSIKIINKPYFSHTAVNIVSKYINDSTNNFPNVTIQNIAVKMNSDQEDLHKKIQSKTIGKQNIKLLGITKNKAKLIRNLNSFLSQTRQLSNVVKGIDKPMPKLESIYLKIMENNNFPVLIYSNFLEAGVVPMKQHILSQNPDLKSKIETISGSLSISQKHEIIEKYNNKKLKILFITSAGSEGLDLKNTRQIHIMEPHWNFAKIDQIIGRGIRYKSHVTLPNSNRKVNVYKWFSIYNSSKGYTADEYLIELSEKKDHFIKIFQDLITDNYQYTFNNINFNSDSPESNFN